MPFLESPLAELHARAGARLADFAGWRLPLQFTSVAAETQATRRAAALFDISHMGLLRVGGGGAPIALGRLLTRDPTAIPAGCSAYALLCNEAGGILDDLFVMIESAQAAQLVVNATNHTKDVAWLREHLSSPPAVDVEDLRGRTFGLALQGPAAEDIMIRAGVAGDLPSLFATFSRLGMEGRDLLVSRTGYTGEDGFEIFGDARDGPHLWRALMAAGQGRGLIPAGLAARDVLRQEMGYPLWGQDLDEETTPVEAGLSWAIDWNADFIGRPALQQARAERRRIGFRVEAQGVARRGAPIFSSGKRIGAVTSGTYSHNLGAAIGQGYIETAAEVKFGDEIEIEVRGRRLASRAARFPLLPRRTRPSWAHSQRRQQQ